MATDQAGDNSLFDDSAALLSARMEAYAASGDWQQVEEIAMRLRTAVMQVAPAERRRAIVALQRSLENVQAQALRSRGELRDKLSAIRRGRDAARAYGSSAGESGRPADASPP